MSESQLLTASQAVHKVPDFYCCYLLQSICKRSSFYIGSTPNPVRRLRQHNGILNNGGAYRTRREGTRPWEMVMIVYGFPNKIAALQFEHAWQHGYSTHYIPTNDRIVKNKAGGRTVHHKLGMVRLLVNNVYFQHMNLVIHFFNAKIQELWQQNKYKIDDNLPFKINVSDNALSVPNTSSTNDILTHCDDNLKLVTNFYNDHIAHDKELCNIYKERLTYGQIPCDICNDTFDYTSEFIENKPYVGFCTGDNCKSVAHLRCLHQKFLDEEQLALGMRDLIPKGGKCPDCSTYLEWTVLVKYSTIMKSQFGV